MRIDRLCVDLTCHRGAFGFIRSSKEMIFHTPMSEDDVDREEIWR